MTFYKLYDLGLSNYFICVVELYGDTIARVWGNMITIKKRKMISGLKRGCLLIACLLLLFLLLINDINKYTGDGSNRMI